MAAEHYSNSVFKLSIDEHIMKNIPQMNLIAVQITVFPTLVITLHALHIILHN